MVRHSAEPRPPGAEPLSRKAARLTASITPRSGAAVGFLICATRPCSASGRPIQRSSPGKSSRRAVPMLRPSTIRNSSPASRPMVMG